MKVLSIKEPFASLIAQSLKKIETRSFKTNYRGELYIHASMTKHKMDNERKTKILSLLPKDYELKEGNIICKVNLKDCIYMDEEFINNIKKDKLEYLCGRYEVGRYAWIISDVKVINEIPAKGKLGIWNFEK